MNNISFSKELYKKYNVPGPRYTSYPTVPFWETSPSELEWVSLLTKSATKALKQNEGMAVYVHIPFCKSLCTYCGCNTRITRKTSVGEPYVETVLKEWKLYLEKVPELKKLKMSELHFGGGTPTFLSPYELAKLVHGILDELQNKDMGEFSIEADPRVTTDDHLRALAKLGFTRLSLGIQDFDQKVQEAVHREQSVEQVEQIVLSARRLGFKSINFDLIYGLPFQTEMSIHETISAVKKIKPDRIAFYSYAHVPWIKPSQRRFSEDDLPVADQKRRLYEVGRELLEQAEYKEIGMDHFALESDSLWSSFKSKKLHRNFMGYTCEFVSPLIGLGVSAIGDSVTCFVQNEKVLETWNERVHKNELPIFRGHVLTDEDIKIRHLILSLMTRFEAELDFNESDFLNIKQELGEFVLDGLLKFFDKKIIVTEKGRPFLRNICMAFDLRLKRKSPKTTLFSQTV